MNKENPVKPKIRSAFMDFITTFKLSTRLKAW